MKKLSTNSSASLRAICTGTRVHTVGMVPGARAFSRLPLLLAWLALATNPTFASDPVGIYALVDKVVLEPSEASPSRVQIWGVFALAKNGGDVYEKPQAGYLYYELNAKKPELCRKEWNDLKSVAGKNIAVGFGARYGEKGQVRSPNQKAAGPDTYPLGVGIVRMRDTDYAPIQSLFELKRQLSRAPKAKSAAPLSAADWAQPRLTTL